MNVPSNDILLALIASSSEPLIVARVDHPDWPVVLANDAFRELIKGAEHETKPLADVIERLLDRELALEVSEVVRAGQRSTIPVEVSGREVMLSLVPLESDSPSGGGRYYAAYWRSANANHQDVQQALAQANRRLRDLSREDPTTGLLNGSAFRDVLEHDWAVAAREQTTLSIVAFGFDDFRAYLDVSGRHATDTSLRRIAQVIRRALRRASDLSGMARWTGRRPRRRSFARLKRGRHAGIRHQYRGSRARAGFASPALTRVEGSSPYHSVSR